MLRIHIQSEAVRRNIHLFKCVIESRQATLKRDYQAAINYLTGAMRFSETETLDRKEWKHLMLHFDLEQHSVTFQEDLSEKEALQTFDPQANRVMKETLKVFQVVVSQIRELAEFSQIHLESIPSQAVAKDIIHETWHQLNRIQTEEILYKRPRGSYLFRKDEYATLLERELSETGKNIKCITLSFLDKKDVVRDRTLVKGEKGWLLYNDDPNLQGEVFESIVGLLASFETALTFPVFAE